MSLKLLEIHLSDTCNLNCQRCAHFAQIAKPNMLDPNDFENSLKLIDNTIYNHFDHINLLGGEPLLNKKICEIIKIARTYIPYNNIRIITNGILLSSMPAIFFETCEKYQIDILVTQYPINIDYNKILENITSKYNIHMHYYTPDVETFKEYNIDITGSQNAEYNFKTCEDKNDLQCLQLVGTKLYVCSVMAYIKQYNSYFNTNITTDEYLDLKDVKSIDEVYKWFNTNKDFCKYCIRNNKKFKWARSTKDTIKDEYKVEET